VGLHAGYGWGRINADTAPWIGGTQFRPFTHSSFSDDGPFGGPQIGYNRQLGRLVLGVEGDFSWSGINGSFNYDPATGPQKTAGGKIKWMATFRGRAGYALNRVLLYATGGLVVDEASGYVNNFWSNTNPADRAKGSSLETGWTAGGGVEYAINDYLSVKGEYLYVDAGAFSGNIRSPAFPSGTWLQVESHTHLHTFRLGLNIKFR
jgi:outer membrane immunogenic protein